MPHVHMLIILAEEDKLRTPEQVDSIISAEIPNPTNCPELNELVLKHMIHQPCTNLMLQQKNKKTQVCHNEVGECSNNFPKQFQNNTELESKQYPKYKRRSPENGGETGFYGGQIVDNQWVIPYNPALLQKYQTHLNVEMCS